MRIEPESEAAGVATDRIVTATPKLRTGAKTATDCSLHHWAVARGAMRRVERSLVGSCMDGLSDPPPDPEHHRTPKRGRRSECRILACVLECDGAPPLLDRRVALLDINPTDPETLRILVGLKSKTSLNRYKTLGYFRLWTNLSSHAKG